MEFSKAYILQISQPRFNYKLVVTAEKTSLMIMIVI